MRGRIASLGLATLALTGGMGLGAASTTGSPATSGPRIVDAGRAARINPVAPQPVTTTRSSKPAFGVGGGAGGSRRGNRYTPNHNRFTGILRAQRAATKRRNQARHRKACRR